MRNMAYACRRDSTHSSDSSAAQAMQPTALNRFICATPTSGSGRFGRKVRRNSSGAFVGSAPARVEARTASKAAIVSSSA
ncbi:hypothetical protein [Nonomuraea africana]|uniref:Uncharacterized protein n=1 Tax=Nonomuraea africana TaxID=46171 RepID=A0ABR9KJ93_9ACTN|nr:hypothetical protein [Nonomuraea africana]MBE1562089.1 hypothetical protein [Nonomuraea africana]